MGGDKTRHHDAMCNILFLAMCGVALSIEREPKHGSCMVGKSQSMSLFRTFFSVFMPQFSMCIKRDAI